MNTAQAISGTFAGLIAGSFIATIAMRWPMGRSVSTGRSHCDHCDRVLAPWALVPLGSWLVQRGRCRDCGGRIDGLHPLLEAGAAAIGAVAGAALPLPDAIAGAAFGWALLLLLALDIRHFWLPDRLTLPLTAGGLAVAFAGLGPDWRDAAIGAGAGFASLWILGRAYRLLRGREGLGGGDPKLFGAIGAWCGWASLPLILLSAAMLGLMLVAIAALRGKPLGAADKVPLGALLAVAAWPVWIALRLGWVAVF